MARTHARIFSSIDEDEDWLELSFGAQWLYQTILRQKKMTLVGQLDYRPARWASLSKGLTPGDVDRLAGELEAANFIVIDRVTNELLVRTFVRHDSGYGRNSNLLKGVWSAWSTIESRMLRKVAVDNIPDEVWASPKVKPPATAEGMRRSPQPEPPVPTTSSDSSSNGGSDQQFGLPDRTVLTPDSCLLTPDPGLLSSSSSVVPETGAAHEAADDDDWEPSDSEMRAARLAVAATHDEQRRNAAAEILGLRDHERAVADGVVRGRPGSAGAEAHRRTCIDRRRADPDLARLLVEEPDWEPEQLADGVDRPDAAPTRHLAAVPSLQPDPNCPYCEGTGHEWLDDGGQGTTRRCACITEAAS